MPRQYYKGFWLHRVKRKGKFYVKADGPMRRKLFPNMSAAKRAVDAWEKRQYQKDKVKF